MVDTHTPVPVTDSYALCPDCFRPEVGYLEPDEKEIVFREARRLAPLVTCGLISQAEAKEMILRRLEEYRTARRFFRAGRKKARGD